LVLGRAPSCDLGLVSPEVAPVHCVIVHVPEGWRVRDCSGRAGTRVNGKAIQDEPLSHGDTLQVGTFSFELHLPACGPSTPFPRGPRPTPSSESPPPSFFERSDLTMLAEVRHLQHSRRNLARLALALRRRARQVGASVRDDEEDGWLERREAELDQQAGNLERLRHDVDFRLRQLQKAQQEVEDRRAALDQESASLREQRERDEARLEAAREEFEERCLEAAREEVEERCRQAEEDLARRRAEEEARLQAAWEEVHERGRQVEQGPTPSGEPDSDLNRRAAELDHYAAHLRRWQERLSQEQKQCGEVDRPAPEDRSPVPMDEELAEMARKLDEERQYLQAQARELADRRAKWDQEQEATALQAERQYEQVARAETALREQREQLARAEAALREQRSEVVRLMAEMCQNRQNARQLTADDEELRQENERLRQELAERDVASSPPEAEKLRALEAEVAALKEQLEAAQDQTATVPAQGADRKPSGILPRVALLDEIAALREQVRERDDRIEELLVRPEEKIGRKVGLEHSGGYEADLAQYHQELERDRALLNEQIAEVQERNAALEEAAREAELQLSRERAQMARDRAELTRLRDEIRGEQERRLRDGGALDRLAPINRLKEELAAAARQGEDGSRPGALRQRNVTGKIGEAPA
jgi:DNA repair exonuclease SbcCD ATPase subunit